MKKIIISLLLVLTPILTPFAFTKASSERIQHGIYCCDEMKEVLDAVQKLPEAQDLIQEILSDGPLYIKINHPQVKKYFDGCWGGTDRTIYVTFSPETPKGLLLSTLLFEMHNAKRNKELDQLDRQAYWRKIKKQDYIRAVEQLEFENVRDTTLLLNKGKRLGIFPKNCHWNYPDTFEEHFRIQQSSGHSKWIAHAYDQMR